MLNDCQGGKNETKQNKKEKKHMQASAVAAIEQ